MHLTYFSGVTFGSWELLSTQIRSGVHLPHLPVSENRQHQMLEVKLQETPVVRSYRISYLGRHFPSKILLLDVIEWAGT